MISFERCLEDMGADATVYYRPGVCERETRLPVDDPERLNGALATMETYLAKYLGICEARVVVCLILYKGLTYAELQAITGMKQSAVSRTISSLKERRLVICRVGKKFEVGRPYQYVVLNVDVNEVVDCIGGMAAHHVEDAGYLKGWLENGIGELHD